MKHKIKGNNLIGSGLL